MRKKSGERNNKIARKKKAIQEWLATPPKRWKTSCKRTERIEDPEIDADDVCMVIWDTISDGEKARIIQANSPYTPKEER